jgi:DNA replication protein DnaC
MLTKSLRIELDDCLKELRLSSLKEIYDKDAEDMSKEGLSYQEYLLQLLRAECNNRRNNRIERNLKVSKIPFEKTLSSFDRNRLPQRLKHQLNVILEGKFLERKENILAFGKPGSGKTHLLCAIGQELIHQGYRVYFSSCSLLIQELLREKRELRLDRMLNKLSKFDALILDDIGYIQQSREEMEVFFTLLAQRYERGSIMISSNLPFSQWETIFKDPMTTAAAIDRLVHHSIILELNIESYRLEQAKKDKKYED